MQTILVADDDQTIREGLRLMLGDIAPQARVLMAGTGAEALETAMRMPIDLILTDVKMPVMSGLELVDNLRQLNFPGEAVIISGFDEFDYVRQALKSGAVDYLLKPVKPQDLRAVYEECARRLQQKRQQPLEMFSLSPGDNPQVQQARLAGLIAGGEGNRSNATVLGRAMDGVFCLVTDSPLSAGRRHAQALRAAFDQADGSQDKALVQGEYMGLWTALGFAQADDIPSLSRLCEETLLGLGLRCGLSDIHHVRACGSAFFEAQAALAACFYDELPQTPQRREPFPYPEHSARFLACAGAEGLAECGRALQELLGQAATDRPQADALRRHLGDLVYSMMNQDKDLIAIIGKYKLTDRDIMLKLREAQSFSQLRTDYQELMLLYLREVQERRLSQDEGIIHKAKAYIEQNYREIVSLGELAQQLNLHPNYFSTLFRSKTGQTFSDCLRSVRIAKAIELMNDTNMKVYEIAGQVGYSDNAQFYRAFKQITGISPGQYKQKHT